MLISHRKRFIYTKTVKTAGTSVEAYFERYCLPEDFSGEIGHSTDAVESEAGIIGFRGRKRPADCRWYNHMSARQIRDQLGAERWNDYLKFCVVRDPFDKAVSAFFHFRNAREKGKLDGGHESLKERFLSYVNRPRAGESLASEFERWLKWGGLVVDRDKYLIDGRICIDEFVRFEDLADGIARVCERIGETFEPDRIPHLKAKTRDRSYSLTDLYTRKSIDLVSKTYAFEIEQFGYAAPEL